MPSICMTHIRCSIAFRDLETNICKFRSLFLTVQSLAFVCHYIAKSVSDWEGKTKSSKRDRDKTNGALEIEDNNYGIATYTHRVAICQYVCEIPKALRTCQSSGCSLQNAEKWMRKLLTACIMTVEQYSQCHNKIYDCNLWKYFDFFVLLCR